MVIAGDPDEGEVFSEGVGDDRIQNIRNQFVLFVLGVLCWKDLGGCGGHVVHHYIGILAHRIVEVGKDIYWVGVEVVAEEKVVGSSVITQHGDVGCDIG